MPLRLSSPITELPRVGPAKAKLLKNLNISYVRDLLFLFPRRYDDFSRITNIQDLKVGERLTIKGTVSLAKENWGFRGRHRLLRIFAEITDGTGVLHVTWYNIRFLAKQLQQGREVYVAGEVAQDDKFKQPGHFVMRSPVLEFVQEDQETTHTARIMPIYPETFGVTSRWIRYQLKNILPLITAIPEYIPKEIRTRHSLIGIHEAIRQIHFPDSPDILKQAQDRLRFDELFFLQLAALVRRRKVKSQAAVALAHDSKKFIKNLPFELTNAQQTALKEILKDMGQAVPMNRLLQGDVGSGKSVVALIATHVALESGYKVLYLAPTEILARQQAESFQKSLGQENVGLLVGSLKESEKKKVKQRLKEAGTVCIIGTHAVLQEDVIGDKIGLVIVDEQHRFGVAQRRTLLDREKVAIPHLLSMTATPIPRTLTLTVYGDLDVSILNELPPGRKPIETKIIAPEVREPIVIEVLEHLHAGRQAYVIAPLIDDSEKLEIKSAIRVFKEVEQLFPGIAVGLLHGQMKPEEKESVMKHFSVGAIQVLVSTSVVEVGVNVPNATMMIIEGAERFGLAQLHQFRGRVGRGEYQSYCYLFPTTEAASKSKRLQVLTRTTDGFKIAEEDLRLRGPGEVYGLAQSGFDDLKVASLLDYDLIKSAREEAEQLLDQDEKLEQYPILQKKVAQKNKQIHFE